MLFVGLGNPGKDYANTHHNVGFMFADKIAECFNVKFKLSKKHQCYMAEFEYNNQKHYIIKPITYMNLSGLSVKSIISYYKINVNDVFIIYDDMDLPLGLLRIRKAGSAGGHNGMKSIIKELGTSEIQRLRVGIDHAVGEREDVIDYVLSQISKSEHAILDKSIELAPNICIDLINNGIDYVMNNYN